MLRRNQKNPDFSGKNGNYSVFIFCLSLVVFSSGGAWAVGGKVNINTFFDLRDKVDGGFTLMLSNEYQKARDVFDGALLDSRNLEGRLRQEKNKALVPGGRLTNQFPVVGPGDNPVVVCRKEITTALNAYLGGLPQISSEALARLGLVIGEARNHAARRMDDPDLAALMKKIDALGVELDRRIENLAREKAGSPEPAAPVRDPMVVDFMSNFSELRQGVLAQQAQLEELQDLVRRQETQLAALASRPDPVLTAGNDGNTAALESRFNANFLELQNGLHALMYEVSLHRETERRPLQNETLTTPGPGVGVKITPPSFGVRSPSPQAAPSTAPKSQAGEKPISETKALSPAPAGHPHWVWALAVGLVGAGIIGPWWFRWHRGHPVQRVDMGYLKAYTHAAKAKPHGVGRSHP